MQKEPQRRFRSAEEILRFLPTQAGVAKKSQTKKKNLLFPIVAAGILLILILIFVVLLKSRSAQKKQTSFAPDTTQAVSGQPREIPTDTSSLPSIAKREVIPTTKNKSLQPEPKKAESEAAVNRIIEPVKGSLWIDCLPWARVIIDSVAEMTTPLKQPVTLDSGWHRLKLKHPAYPDYETRIYIPPAKTVVFKANLDTLFGYLDCEVYPWGKIFVDGKYIDDSPLRSPLRIIPGEHVLTITNPQFPTYEKRFTANKNDTLRIRVKLNSDSGEK
ncbi:MAG: PEGA domain-containing protein [Calditrichaeota bacterium]|nr:PEGA domain-containing protein [Calditrichota bacterium]